MPKPSRLLCALMIIFSGLFIRAAASGEDRDQSIEELKKQATKVFIDCDHCDLNFIRTELDFVNFVRNREDADVHILITEQDTGGGGREYTVKYIGLKDCADLQNTLKYYANRVDTRDEVRAGLARTLKLGLGPYIARTPMARGVELTMKQKVKATSVEDDWDHWVFNLSTRVRLNGEQSRKSHSFSGSVSANRVTSESKFRVSVWANYDKSVFDYEDTYIESLSRSKTVDSMYVKSLGEHWSVGAVVNASASTYSNLDFSLSVHPAVEFDLFPYSESTRRQLRFLYKIGFNYDNYTEMTIYEKMTDRLWNQSLTVSLEFTEPWGNAQVSMEGSHYFHDLKYNRLMISGELNLRIFKGLSLSVNGRYSKVRDQLNLAAGEASLEELLLRRKELLSGYRYNLSVGLSYSFGSVYSSVVNPRFGSGARYEDMRF